MFDGTRGTKLRIRRTFATSIATATMLAVAVTMLVTAGAWSPALAAPQAQSSGESPQLPGFESVQTETYELYAPNGDLLQSAQQPLDAAVERFRQYFGEAPPQIAVVVFESPEQAQSADIGNLRSRGLPVLPWVAPEFLETRAFPNLGIIVRQTSAGGGVSVVGQLSIESPSGLQIQQGDLLTQLNGTPIQSIDDLQTRYDAVEVGSTVELTINRQDDEHVQTFTKPPARYRIVQGGGGPDPGAILSHEAGHIFFVNYVDRQIGRPGPSTELSYGHPAIPDWFDEAVALLSEPPEMQAQRLSALQDQLQRGASLLPLTELFELSHPRSPRQNAGPNASESSNTEQIVPGIGLSVGGSSDPTTEDGSLTPTYAIYYQTSALAQYLREQEGAAFIGQIAHGLMQGQSMEEILAGARNVPSDPEALREALHEWVLQSGGQ